MAISASSFATCSKWVRILCSLLSCWVRNWSIRGAHWVMIYWRSDRALSVSRWMSTSSLSEARPKANLTLKLGNKQKIKEREEKLRADLRQRRDQAVENGFYFSSESGKSQPTSLLDGCFCKLIASLAELAGAKPFFHKVPPVAQSKVPITLFVELNAIPS